MSGLQMILLALFLGALFIAVVLTVEALAERHDYADKDPIPGAGEITDQLGDLGTGGVPLADTRRLMKRIYKLARLHRSTPAGGDDDA